MDVAAFGALIPIVAIVCVFVFAMVRAIAHSRVRELEVRERIAMIERGLVPPPEKDPQGFDRAMMIADRLRDDDGRYSRRSPHRYRTGGITMIGIGFGLMILISFAGDAPGSGIGVGGFLVVMGLAFLLNGLIGRHDEFSHSTRYASYAPPGSSSPPPPGQGSNPSNPAGESHQ